MDSTKKRPSERNFKEKNLSTFPIRDLYPEQKKPPPAQLYRKPYRSHFDFSFPRFSEDFCDFFLNFFSFGTKIGFFHADTAQTATFRNTKTVLTQIVSIGVVQ